MSSVKKELANQFYSNMMVLTDLEELSIYIKKVNILLFDKKETNKLVLATIHNCYETIKDINIMAQHSEEYDEITKIESIKKLLTVHQELLIVVRQGDCKVVEEITGILHKLTVLYPLLLLGYALQENNQ